MPPPVCCAACVATRAQLAKLDSSTQTIEVFSTSSQTENEVQSEPKSDPESNSDPEPDAHFSSPGKPYPIPPTSGTDSHPYAEKVESNDSVATAEAKVPETKAWIQPKYHVVIEKDVDADVETINQLVAGINLPDSKEAEAAAAPKPTPNVPLPSNTPPIDSLVAAPRPRPNVPLPPNAPPNEELPTVSEPTQDAPLLPDFPQPIPPTPWSPDAPQGL